MPETTPLSPHAVISHGEQQVSTVVDGVTVLMNVGNGKYYKLDDIGSRIWTMIETPATVSSVCERLVQEYEVDPTTCEAEVLTLLDRLLENSLINVVSQA